MEAIGGADIGSAVGSFCLIFIGSVLIGVFGGCAIALLFKIVNLRRHAHAEAAAQSELIVLICLSYTTFLAAEYARLSGIVASL